jgi:hypothetical protein
MEEVVPIDPTHSPSPPWEALLYSSPPAFLDTPASALLDAVAPAVFDVPPLALLDASLAAVLEVPPPSVVDVPPPPVDLAGAQRMCAGNLVEVSSNLNWFDIQFFGVWYCWMLGLRIVD